MNAKRKQTAESQRSLDFDLRNSSGLAPERLENLVSFEKARAMRDARKIRAKGEALLLAKAAKLSW